MGGKKPSFKYPTEELCDDTLAHVLSFLDVSSAVRFSVCSNMMKDRIYPSKDTHGSSGDIVSTRSMAKNTANDSKATFERLWRDVYFRHNFSPPEEPVAACSKINYLSECRKRRSLFKNLAGRRKNKHNISCFSLPNRYFHFHPVVPTDTDDIEEWIDDPPPVEFSCESYALTSPGTSGEIVLMDPFNGSISVYDNVLDNAVASDEAMMEKAMLDATSAIISRREANENSGEDDSITSSDDAGEAIDEHVYRNHNIVEYRTPPSQVLFGVEDYFDVNLSAYFVPTRNTMGENGLNMGNGRMLGDEEDEIVIDWLGIDTHTIIDDNNDITGTVIGAARILISDVDPLENEKTCIEILGWRRTNEDLRSGKGYDTKFICRLHGAPYYIDMCARHNNIYASYPRGEGPFESILDEVDENHDADRESQVVQNENEVDGDDDGDDATADWNGLPINQTNTIVRYPLVSVVEENDRLNDEARKPCPYFPSPETSFRCKHPVSCFTVDPTGNRLAAGTIKGTVEIWDVSVKAMPKQETSNKPIRLQTLDIGRAFEELDKMFSLGSRDITGESSSSSSGSASLSQEPSNSSLDTLVASPSANQRSTNNDLDVETDCLQDREIEIEDFDIEDSLDAQRISLDTQLTVDVEHVSSVVDDTNDNTSGLPGVEDEGSHISANPLHPNPSSKVANIHIPRHCPIDQCGLVTSQHSREHGTVLLLWQKDFMNESNHPVERSDLKLAAMINVPLSAQHNPQISFDGRRLVVFGQDHIGLIVLIYHVLSTREDQNSFSSVKSRSIGKNIRGDESGGVTNLGVEKRVKFVNRIRQIGLGGLEYYDSMFMTCNERFIIVNTKAGNLVGGSSECAATEGLFVIDLEEHA